MERFYKNDEEIEQVIRRAVRYSTVEDFVKDLAVNIKPEDVGISIDTQDRLLDTIVTLLVVENSLITEILIKKRFLFHLKMAMVQKEDLVTDSMEPIVFL